MEPDYILLEAPKKNKVLVEQKNVAKFDGFSWPDYFELI